MSPAGKAGAQPVGQFMGPDRVGLGDRSELVQHLSECY